MVTHSMGERGEQVNELLAIPAVQETAEESYLSPAVPRVLRQTLLNTWERG